jgi:magnesium chelatase family protein
VRPRSDYATVRVARARERQRARGRSGATRLNAELSSRTLRRLCPIPPDAHQLLAAAMTRLGLSARGHDRVVRVARTIADLAGAETIATEHCAEALQYRGLDRRWRA